MSRVVTGINDLQTKYPDVAAQWHPDKNGELIPSKVSAGSGKKAWWLCENGHEWEAVIGSRAKAGRACPFCAGQRVIVGENDLASQYPAIAAQWHPNKNEGLMPWDVFACSGKKVWWICEKNHDYQQIIEKKTLRGFGCPYCSGHRVMREFNDLASLNPSLSAEWHPIKNGSLKPFDVTANSGKKVWWLCPNGHEYEAVVRDRNQGTRCPVCDVRRQTSFAEQAILFYVKKLFPDAIGKYKSIFKQSMELDIYIPSLKVGIEFDGCGWHNNDIVIDREIRKYNICKEQGIKLIRFKERIFKTVVDDNGQKHKIEIEARREVADEIYTINKVRSDGKELGPTLQYVLDKLDPKSNMWTRRNIFQVHSTVQVDIEKDISEIQKYLLKVDNNLAEKRPDVLDKWDYEANGYLKPEMFSIGSNEIVKWKCPNCGHKWKSSINSMTREGRFGCAECSKVRSGITFTKGIVKQRGSLAENMPELAAEWHPTKNGDLTPYDVTTGRFKTVWWLCDTCKYEWQASPANRKKGVGCPHCSGRVAKPGLDDIVTVFPDIIKYWDFEENKNFDPATILPGSGKIVAWKCFECNHKWTQLICRRVKSQYYCPKCKCKKSN